jgi:hypothetical protein
MHDIVYILYVLRSLSQGILIFIHFHSCNVQRDGFAALATGKCYSIGMYIELSVCLYVCRYVSMFGVGMQVCTITNIDIYISNKHITCGKQTTLPSARNKCAGAAHPTRETSFKTN